MIKRSSFLLLEILLGISLVAIALCPIINSAFTHLRGELQLLREAEMQRLADQTFAKIKILLYQNQIPWKTLSRKLTLFPIEKKRPLLLPGWGSQEISRSFAIKIAQGKEGPQGIYYSKLLIQVILSSEQDKEEKQYRYFVFAATTTDPSQIPSSGFLLKSF